MNMGHWIYGKYAMSLDLDKLEEHERPIAQRWLDSLGNKRWYQPTTNTGIAAKRPDTWTKTP